MHTFRPEPADPDPVETREWIDSVEAVVQSGGERRARYLIKRVIESALRQGVLPQGPLTTDYINTIPPSESPEHPGDARLEKRIRRIIRWNAVAMVHRANLNFSGIGGHLSTYASSASLYEIGFNHFFRGKDDGGSGDHIYFQGHAAPGMYARAFLEGRVGVDQLERFRREVEGNGLSSYPHPRLMPDFWEYPTVSMGLGPLSAIYQARFNRYLHNRGIADTSDSRIWCFVGDGETDEPEALGSLSIAAREGLDNLVFVVNCNLQRLDGPVRGNGKIMQELEAVFRGAGWNVIKVVHGPEWDALFEKDTDGILLRRWNEVVDGDEQKYATSSGSYTRNHFFGTDPRLLQLVADISDEQIRRLRRGGHSFRKLYAAYRAAVATEGQPTVILAKTVKGWTLGEGFEGSNVTHQKKKLELEELRQFRDLLELPVPDSQLDEAPFYHPGVDSEEVQYLLERRRALGGCVPKRRSMAQVQLTLPGEDEVYGEFFKGMKKGEASTTMVFSRLLSKLLRDKGIGRRIVPIIPDEARTFGIDALFSQVGIYSSKGQLYEPVDKGRLLYYRESKDGQVLEEGITEAGSMASFLAAATSYSVHGEPMIPFYIFYSMFGFQRVGDLMWASGDMMARGFLLGATAGRTTLAGEGLQHNDGHSPVLMSAVPSMRSYDVAYAYELALVIQEGLRRMVGEQENIVYYITLQNEAYPMPAMPEGVQEGVLRGLYKYRGAEAKASKRAQLFGSGSILNAALRAQEILAERFDVAADVWSVTSYPELRRDALACERFNRLHPEEEPRVPFVESALAGAEGPIIAASDYMKLHADQIARWVPRRFVPLGTDGFGMSDTREGLRRHFEVDAESIVVATLDALRLDGKVAPAEVSRAIREMEIDPDKRDPLSV